MIVGGSFGNIQIIQIVGNGGNLGSFGQLGSLGQLAFGSVLILLKGSLIVLMGLLVLVEGFLVLVDGFLILLFDRLVVLGRLGVGEGQSHVGGAVVQHIVVIQMDVAFIQLGCAGLGGKCHGHCHSHSNGAANLGEVLHIILLCHNSNLLYH